ncbi:MAG TPA: hypothetical protein VFR73_22795 [Hyphomicrobiaceae bacterium]|nr:hypothetical protein [Hyphomicrobiaceae bacterium]
MVDALLRRHSIYGGERPHECRGIAVGDHDALRPAGGARRVDDVADVVGAGRVAVVRQRLTRLRLDLVDVAVDHQNAGRGSERKAGRQCPVGDYRAHLGISEDVLDALTRKLGIDRHVAGTGLQDAEQRSKQQMRFGQVETDQRAAADAAGAQPVRNLIGEIVELFVAQCFAERLDGRPRRAAGNLGFEKFM